MPGRSFTVLAAAADPPLDELALALARELRAGVDRDAAMATLDALGAEVRADGGGATPDALRRVLGERHGFTGDRDDYDNPRNSMLDEVLERRRGLPILLSVVYVETARRAGLALAGVGLPGHFVVGHFETYPPILLDPFAGGTQIPVPRTPALRPWGAHETALRMLNNLVGSYGRRNDFGRAIRAAEMRLELPLERALSEVLEAELRALRARLN